MPRPRRKPFWRWTPLPWLVLVLLMLVTGSMHDAHQQALYLAFAIVSVLFAAALAVGLVVGARRRDPHFTAEGRLLRLEGLELVEAPLLGHPAAVADARRHQIDIEVALAHGSRAPRALLVTDSCNWWNLRSDIAVYLLSERGFHYAGRLGDQAQTAWQARLDALRAAGRFAVVPAQLVGAARPYAVDVRLDGIAELA